MGDRPRRAGTAPAQPELRRRDAGVLGELRRSLLPVRVAPRVAARLRQGRAGPAGAGVARLRAGALPRRGGRSRVTSAGLAERALGQARGDALAHVTRERSLTLRFADGRPTQATALDDFSVELAVVRDGHVGRASTNDLGGEALAGCARRAEAAAEAAAATSRTGVHPGFAA